MNSLFAGETAEITGTTKSKSRTTVLETKLKFPASSVATPAGIVTWIFTSFESGVTLKVNTSVGGVPPGFVRSKAVPPVTLISLKIRRSPTICSLKVTA